MTAAGTGGGGGGAALAGQRCLVLGATSRIGGAIARALLDAGAAVLLHGGRDPGRAAALGQAMGAEALAADLTDPAAREALRRRAEALGGGGGRLDALVLSAGLYERGEDPAALRRQLEANVTGPYALLRALLPCLVAAQGQVVFLNSTQGLNASAEVGQYAATQHALRAIADSLREEVNPRGVRVLSVFLGRTASDRQRAIFAMEGRDYPEDRLIQPADVAHVVLAMLTLPRTAEATNVTLRPMRKT